MKHFYTSQHFYYPDKVLLNLYNSLKTKPFVILSGVSGSGKSKIINLFAEYYSNELSYSENYELVSVKPNWTDSRALFGYHNIIDDTYSITPVIKLFLRALQNPDKPYFLVLDEMNLAKVEHYFSDFLSVIESRKYEYKRVKNTEIDIQSIKSSLQGSISLSQAIILSALQLGTTGFESIETYRNTPISQWWLSNSNSQNPEAQYRTELNQGRKGEFQPNGYKKDGERLAGRAFWAEVQGDSYKLKTTHEMDARTRSDFQKIKEIYDRYSSQTPDSFEEIVTLKQDKIVLHNMNSPLKTEENQVEYSETLYSETNGYYVPSQIEIPLNVFVVGTVNIDETTNVFSPKVLDRSNVIEFNEIDVLGTYGFKDEDESEIETEMLSINNDSLNLVVSVATTQDTKWFIDEYPLQFKILYNLFKKLKAENKHFGYRVFNEIALYVKNYVAHAPSDVDVALDNQILQKVLPKLNGDFEELEEVLITLKESIPDTYLNSTKKLDEMIKRLQSTGYVTFIK